MRPLAALVAAMSIYMAYAGVKLVNRTRVDLARAQTVYFH